MNAAFVPEFPNLASISRLSFNKITAHPEDGVTERQTPRPSRLAWS